MSDNTNRIHEIFSILRDLDPEPTSELNYTNPYTLLVAVILSAQSTDAGVNKATKTLFEKYDTPQKMIDLGVFELRHMIKTIGLYNSKARNIMTMSNDLVEKFNGEVPDNLDDLVSLAGVGRKTANVVLNVAFGQPTMAVDTHVFRVSHRLGLTDAMTPDAVEKQLLKIIPDEFMRHAHHWLILQGRYTCKARNPMCGKCPIAHLCHSDDKVDTPYI